jgi:hypothetical protein
MSSNRAFAFGPVALTTTLTTDLLNPPTATGGVNAGALPQFITLKHVRITNKTTDPAAFSLWLGASAGNAAGTEFIGTGIVVAANGVYDWYSSGRRLDAAHFLVGGASVADALTIAGEGEIGVA